MLKAPAPAPAPSPAMESVELVFIPSPLMGHLGQAVELANLIITRFRHLTVTVLVMKLPADPITTNYTNSLSSSSPSPLDGSDDESRIKFIQFPLLDPDTFKDCTSAGTLADMVIEYHKPLVRTAVASIRESSPQSTRLGALIVDMFCTSMIDVGKEFGIPTYVFFTSNAAFLGLMFHLQTLQDEHGQEISELGNSATELVIPSYLHTVPPSVLPFVLLDKKSWFTRFLRYTRKYREAKGIIVNTFSELESHALLSYDNKTPPVYPIGPMLKPEKPAPNNEILQWLDDQPKSLVVFLCFGSRGWFDKDQVREIAVALERSGYRFVWSLRKPPTTDSKGFPGEYADPSEVLPDGFLERTASTGKVIGWAPQTAVLSHVAIGGFVSHCGWNSILESLWHGVPIATWPLYAEQQIDAYQLVRDLGLGVEITLDYSQQKENQSLVIAEEIEKGIREVMKSSSEVGAKVEEMRDKSRMALEEDGSSSASLRRLVQDFM